MARDLFRDEYPFYKHAKISKLEPPNSLLFTHNTSFCELSHELKCQSTENSKISSLSNGAPFLAPTDPSEPVYEAKIKIFQTLEIKKFNGKYPKNRLSKLPGPLPITLTRKRLPVLSEKNFWVSEKSDGERCLMLITKEKTFLIDRSFLFYRLKSDFYSNNLWKKGDTILDGELIFEENLPPKHNFELKKGYSFLKNKPVYLIFDIIMFEGVGVCKENLTTRFEKIGMFNLSYRQNLSLSHPLAILAKTFYRSKSFKVLLKMVSYSSEQKMYVFNDNKRGWSNYNDGFIFTPEDDGYLQRKKTLFKWKWSEMNSLDFRVNMPYFPGSTKYIDAYCGGNDYDPLFLKKLGPFRVEDVTVLRRLMGQSKKEFCIIEASLALNSKGHRIWAIDKVRIDRNIPNHVSTIIRTMEVLADAVNIDEIRFYMIN